MAYLIFCPGRPGAYLCPGGGFGTSLPLLQLITMSSGSILDLIIPCLGCAPRPRNKPGGSVLLYSRLINHCQTLLFFVPEIGHLLLVAIHHAEAILVLNNTKAVLLCSLLLFASLREKIMTSYNWFVQQTNNHNTEDKIWDIPVLSYLGLLLQVVMDVCEITLGEISDDLPLLQSHHLPPVPKEILVENLTNK